VKVTLKGEGVQHETLTDKYGIYSFTVDGERSYVARAEADGLIAESDTVYLAKTGGNEKHVVAAANMVGNSWGNDMVLAPPAAQVGDETYPTLDKAVAAAKALSASEDMPVVMLLEKISQDKAVNIDFGCLIASGSDDPSTTEVVRAGNASITVAAGGRLMLSNVVFAASSSTPVTVEESGCLTLAGKVDFGVGDSVAAVKTADAAGLEVAGALDKGFSLDCAAAENLGQAFGKISAATAEEAAAIAAKISNFNDESGEIRGAAEGSASPFVLKWA
jgi:hypothetical protein